MSETFFFYDLETSGLNPRYDRIMQFAGQRTDMDLRPIGEPYNILVKLSDDILPSPEALLVTGITPQQTASEGITEAKLTKILTEEIFIPNTIALGFNNIRFDDEFIRHTLWRNFYDPYEWSWADGRSRWDLLDAVRMVRSLRPDKIKWPFDKDGKPSNRLELLAKANKLDHIKAHDALSDVEALIAVARLLRDKQPKIYNYLLDMRGKKAIAELVNLDEPKPFVYTSGRYDAANEKTTIALPVAPGRKPGSTLVYDLRMAIDETDEESYPPVKELAYNRCPAVAPLGVMNEAAWKRINLDIDTVEGNLLKLKKNQGLLDKIIDDWNSREDFPPAEDVEGQLYDSFTPDTDKARIRAVHSANPEELADFHPNFTDERLPELLFRYKARNFPQSLSESELKKWEKYRVDKLNRELPGYMNRLAQLAAEPNNRDKQFLLEEIQLWAESIMPIETGVR